MDVTQLSMGVHARGIRRWEQAEALLASQENVQIVMEVMVQTTAGACRTSVNQ